MDDVIRWDILMNNVPPTTRIFQLLRLLFRAGSPCRSADAIYERRFHSLWDGVLCTVRCRGPRVSRFASVRACMLTVVRCRRSPGRAWRLWKDMIIWGVQPDAMAYNTMIKLCAETNQYEKAMTFLDDMDMDDHRPSRITMEALIKAAATAPQWIRVGCKNPGPSCSEIV